MIREYYHLSIKELRHTLLKTRFGERNQAGEKQRQTLKCQGHSARMMSEWFPSLSDGMSEKTLSDRETDGEVRLNGE